jgi:hypothetical protein
LIASQSPHVSSSSEEKPKENCQNEAAPTEKLDSEAKKVGLKTLDEKATIRLHDKKSREADDPYTLPHNVELKS